jgi:hypothetical protein
MWELRRLTTLWSLRTCYRVSFTLGWRAHKFLKRLYPFIKVQGVGYIPEDLTFTLLFSLKSCGNDTLLRWCICWTWYVNPFWFWTCFYYHIKADTLNWAQQMSAQLPRFRPSSDDAEINGFYDRSVVLKMEIASQFLKVVSHSKIKKLI